MPSLASAGTTSSRNTLACREASSPVSSPDLLQHLARHQAGGGAHGDAGGDPALQAGDPDHEELVEVAREDGQEPGPLQQRQVVVLGQLEHALVEAQPGQLAVQEPVLELAGRELHVLGRVRRIHVEDVRRDDPQARVERALLGVGADGGLEALGRHG